MQRSIYNWKFYIFICYYLIDLKIGMPTLSQLIDNTNHSK